ncbi:MAG: histidine kinase [Ginsengibacter sp.]
MQYYARTDSAELCVNKAYLEATALNYKLGIGGAFVNLGEIYLRRWNFYTARKYIEKAISVFKNIDAQTELIQAYSILEDVFLSIGGDDTSAINCANMLLAYYKKSKDSVGEANAWDALSSSYSWQGKYEKAFECDQNQFNLLKNRSDPSSVLNMLRNREGLYQLIEWDDSVAMCAAKIDAYEKKTGMQHPSEGSAYFWTGKFDSAEFYNKRFRNFLVSDNGYDSITKERAILRSDIDLASIYQYEGRYKEALPMFIKALQYDKEKGVADEEDEELMNITMIYDLEGKYTDAIHYGEALISSSVKTKASYYRQKAYQELWSIYNKKEDSANAYKYYTKYTGLKDSTITQTFQRKLMIINELNNEKQQEEQIDRLDKDNKLKQDTIKKNILIRNILITDIVVLILIAFIIYRFINLKRKNEKLEKVGLQHLLDIERIQNEKDQSDLKKKAAELEIHALRAQMNPHFIFNSLNSINLFILQNNKLQASKYLSKFSKLIRLILQNSQEALIPLEKELEALELYLELESLRFENKFEYRIIAGDALDTGLLKVPPLFIQPYVENAIWHGLMYLPRTEKEGKRGIGHLKIILYSEDAKLFCKITDNGIGREKAAALKSKPTLTHKSMGMRITADRIAMLQQQNRMETYISVNDLTLPDGSAAGTEVIIKMPLRYD